MLHDLLDTSAARWAGQEALRYKGASRSYAALAERSVALARGLYSLGVRRSDRVVVHLHNRPEVVELALACSRIGAIFVPANALLKPRQLDYVLRDSGARVLVCSFVAAAQLRTVEAVEALDAVVWCDTAVDGSDVGPRMHAYEELVSSSAAPFTPSAATEDDPAALLYTSGSTGRPKGVVLSQRNITSGARIVSDYLENTSSDRILAALPLSFDYGLSQVTTALCVGACAVLTSYTLPAALVNELVQECITGVAGVPTMWMHLAAIEWPPSAAEHLRYITNSGGALPPATISTLVQRAPKTRVFCMYGLTEAFRSTYLHPDELERRPGSIGKAIAGQEVIVARPDGSECAPGEIGELVHRGSLVTLGYWNDPELTARRFRPLRRMPAEVPRADVAVWSGDLAKTDSDGFLYFVGREDHMIKSSGYRISPTDIEEVVLELAGVVETAAIGVPDDTLGQRIVLAIVAACQNAEEVGDRVRQYCRMQLPPYMVPVEIHVIDAIPRNVNGKCDPAALRSQLDQGRRTTRNAAAPERRVRND